MFVEMRVYRFPTQRGYMLPPRIGVHRQYTKQRKATTCAIYDGRLGRSLTGQAVSGTNKDSLGSDNYTQLTKESNLFAIERIAVATV